MKRWALPALLALVAIFVLVAAGLAIAYTGGLFSPRETVAILHTNDFHGSMEGEKITVGDKSFVNGGSAYLAGFIDGFRQEYGGRVLVLDAGDIWQGTFPSNQDKGQTVVACLNLAGYDAAAPGNHEWDFGWEVLRDRAAEAKFPFLAANLVEEATGKTPPYLKPYTIKTVAGVRFGIIGLTYPSAAIIKASAVQGLKFSSGTEAVRKYLPEVRQQSDVVIVLSHLGLASSYPGQDGDTELAMAVPGIDIIVGGHSHVELRNARRVGDALIVQAGSKGKYLGRLELTIDKKTKKIVSAKTQDELVGVVSTKTIPNAAVAQIVQKRLDEAGAIMNRPLGESLVDMTESCYSGECLLGNLIVDAMRAANQAGDRPADVAMHNNAGVRSQLYKGPINYGQLYLVLPFDNVLEAVDLTGAQLLQILEKAVSGRPGNMLVSGLTYEFDQSKPIGERILKVTVGGQPLDPNKVYRVQTIDYLASGGDGQTTFTEGQNPVYGDPTVDVVAEYIRTHSPVSLKVEGRIVGK